ncbi:hypothetical protein CsSME_00049482 [Camellia sinensis var. sinensis]|uniref:Late embryogenesis abundant protein LEA-2 subgroup domain-containing protein n=1 Tax=Camellia sinensis TaxID=4442 RepID=A0A7J7G5P5_CAMSI|nr:uncharacterized protein LOC114269052 [Camellia sinensis]KAF5936029.1 hypothetical protein HYC85_027158 [Camellia sinensis]
MDHLPDHGHHHHHAMSSKHMLPKIHHTSPFIWFVAVLCTVITVAVIIAGIIVFAGYIAIRPRIPFISVTYSHLDLFEYSQAGVLTTKVSITIKWENDNAKAHASFYDAAFILSLHGFEIAKLVAPPFDVRKNSFVEFAYQVESSPISLSPDQMDLVDMYLKQDLVKFGLIGTARTRWRVGLLGSVKFTLHLNCHLNFIKSSMNSTGLYCSSRK